MEGYLPQDLDEHIRLLITNKAVIFEEELSSETLESITSVTFILKLDEKYLEKYKINDPKLQTLLIVEPNNSVCKWYYDGNEIIPDGYWMLPKDYEFPTLIEILQKAVKQQTNRPNIK
jgi:hypothetical protein